MKTAADFDPEDILTCDRCGVEEHIDLVDAEIGADGNATGQHFCIGCYPGHWEPAFDDTDIDEKSIAPTLAPVYATWRAKCGAVERGEVVAIDFRRQS